MNHERLIYIAEWLEAGAPHKGKVKGFDISVGVQVIKGQTPACGTTCCIAGAATQFFNDEEGALVAEAFDNICDWQEDGTTAEADWDNVFEEAQELLGLTFDQARQLFVPVGTYGNSIYGDGSNWEDFNDPYKTARVIRNLVETDKVDWSIK
ncbi:hypothetical protein [Xanthomonas phage BUDD]|nr:hypothetical protein [Xanthomonas phage BUDD]